MSGRQIEATARGLQLIAQGVSVRAAAKQVGVAPSTLTRAKKRAGCLPAQAGRPAAPGA
jgi:transposase